MPYISSGTVVAARSPYRLSILADAFWWVVNLVGLFFACLWPTHGRDPPRHRRGGQSWGGSSGGGGGGGPPRPPSNRHTASATLASVECPAAGG